MKGRQIVDSILIANECLDSRLKSKIPWLVCKIDLEKAFDNVKWSFVDEVLNRMGFGLKWRKWIGGCIRKIPFSVLINGTSCGKFTSEKGLRQGDPVSPFVFLLVSEVLSMMFAKSTEVGWLGGFSVKQNGTKLSHLQFADDTLVFLDADIRQVQYLKYTLLSFEMASGLSTNFQKSNLFAVGEVEDLDTLAAVMGCSFEGFPVIYLGLPLGDKTNTISKWDKVLEICRVRLASWKRGLSKAGKLTLIKSVLLSIPVYYFSLFMAPQFVIKQIEKSIRDFLWHDGDNGKKHYWVNWGKVGEPLDHGGLGIRRLKLMNKSILSKWCWRLGRERDSLWANIIFEKHGLLDLGWRTRKPTTTHGVSLWKNIDLMSSSFFEQCIFKVGKVDKIRLWEDNWHSQGSMAELCPRLYDLSSSKGISLSRAYSLNSSGLNWNLGIGRSRLYEVEITEFATSTACLDSIHFEPHEEDELLWQEDKSGQYSVKAAYNLAAVQHPVNFFRKKKIWSSCWPQKISFFLWQATLDRLPTLDNLHKRKSALVSPSGNPIPNLCMLCKQHEESSSHMFFNCSFSKQVWTFLFDAANKVFIPPDSVLDCIKRWQNFKLSAHGDQL